MFKGIWRDLVYAGRSLAKARAFTFVCVVSLGIGMAPVIAIPYAARISTMPPPGVNTEGLVELVTTPLGSRGADDTWSYPDFVDLRDADTGIVMIGWAIGESEVTPQTPAEAKSGVDDVCLCQLLQTIGVTLARGPGFDAKRDDCIDGGARRDSRIQILAEPAGLRSGHRREDADLGRHAACRGRYRAGSI